MSDRKTGKAIALGECHGGRVGSLLIGEGEQHTVRTGPGAQVRPRSVGELAELTGLRQPQTTKHLQTLARAGLVSVHPLGSRRVYALEPAPLMAFERRLRELVEAAEAHAGERDVLARYRADVDVPEEAEDEGRLAPPPVRPASRSAAALSAREKAGRSVREAVDRMKGKADLDGRGQRRIE